ncbi:MAG: aspartate dehydrogenase domain-containing protein [Candidatus Heimdallarchaeota archaeon]
MPKMIGLVGFGRIGSYLFEKAQENKDIEVSFVYEPSVEKTDSLDKSIVLDTPEDVFNQTVDLIVEAADFGAVKDYAPLILEKNNIMILSATALADQKLLESVTEISFANKTRIFIPHGALLGMDGLFDARKTLVEVEVTTWKHPRNIDFSFTDEFSEENITEETVLYEGPTRGACSQFPRNVNAHAVVALSCIGFERTKSKLIANPDSDDAIQLVIARGGGASLEIRRASVIKGVTGDYTLVSLYGSVIRALTQPYGLTVV